MGKVWCFRTILGNQLSGILLVFLMLVEGEEIDWMTTEVPSWFNPSQHLSSTPSWWDGVWFARVKARKLLGWDKDNLISKAKAVHTSKAKQGIHSLFPIGRQVSSHHQESRTQSHVVATWEDKCHHSEHPPFLLPPTFYCWAWCMTWCGIFLWPVGVSCPTYVFSQLLVHP